MTTSASPRHHAAPSPSAGGKIVVYKAPGGEARVDVRFDGGTVRFTQRQMAEAFATTPENVLAHLRNVFASGELEAGATTKDFLAVRAEAGRASALIEAGVGRATQIGRAFDSLDGTGA